MQAIERIRAALDADVKGYGNLNHTWATDEDDEGNFGLHIVGANVDGELYPVLEIDTAQYFQETDAPKLAEYYAACNPAAMTEVLAHITALEAENERLRTESEERLQNCAALIAENERLRKDAERVDWMQRQDLDELSFGILQDQPGDGDYVVWAGPNVCAGKTFRDAVDAAMKGIL